MTVSHEFTEPGEYTIEVQGTRRIVSVQEPAAPRVTGLSILPSDPEIGSEHDIVASVQNDDDIPANGTIALLLNERTLATESIRLKPGEGGTVSVSYSVEGPGDLVFRVGDHSVSFRIATPTPPPTILPTVTRTVSPSPVATTTEIPGFGWVTVGRAIALVPGINR